MRKFTEQICEPLETEDYVIQSMPDVSPPKWHLGHTSWFFETFILKSFVQNYQPFHPEFHHIFNSYYKTLGSPFQRCRRGLLSRPTVKEVYRYRNFVTERIQDLIESSSNEVIRSIRPLLILGINHEQQHQELLFTDIKHLLWTNPLKPSYRPAKKDVPVRHLKEISSSWVTFSGGIYEIGYRGDGFAFDNEKPRHKVYVDEFSLGSQLITNKEFLEFMEADGYCQPALWLSDGWNCVEKYKWNAPLYWEKRGDQWWNMTLQGMRPLILEEPVCHVSFFEANAFARWKNSRLPTEAEWEIAAASMKTQGNFAEEGYLHPCVAGTLPTPSSDEKLHQMYGDVWEWTGSSYLAYPGFSPLEGAPGEYNGKFMCNQFILRGGSCATPKSHIRPTYRNFFAPDTRWQFSGFRLAKASFIA